MKYSTKNSDLLKLSSILAIIGLILIIFNGRIAHTLRSIWIQSLGGMSDTNEYIFIKTSYANASLVIGGILLHQFSRNAVQLVSAQKLILFYT